MCRIMVCHTFRGFHLEIHTYRYICTQTFNFHTFAINLFIIYKTNSNFLGFVFVFLAISSIISLTYEFNVITMDRWRIASSCDLL